MSGNRSEEISGELEKPSHPEHVSRETSGRDGGNKRSSVYVYLAVLFGAAFLMLLLAYFVQQRNSATMRSDLRSTTASREELLEDIKALEQEKAQLAQKADALQQKAEELQQAYGKEQEASRQRQSELSNQLASWSLFWSMDSAYRAKDYEACAGFFLNEFASQTYATPAEAEERAAEIHQNLVRLGYLAEGDEPPAP